MKDPIFKIETFNQKKETIDKLYYLLDCLTYAIPVKQFTESENQYNKRIIEFRNQCDFDLPESKDMMFMLGLIKKYNYTNEDIIISEYQSYINDKVLSKEEIINKLGYLVDCLEQLESESFEGWSEDSINGYLTASKSIKEKIKQIKK